MVKCLLTTLLGLVIRNEHMQGSKLLEVTQRSLSKLLLSQFLSHIYNIDAC